MNSKVILLAGQYGTSHKTVANTLCKMANERLSPTTWQPIAKTYSIDDEVWERSGGPTAFFKLPNDKMRDAYWQDACSLIERDILKDNPVYAIVSLHIVYFGVGEKRFFSCVDWDRLMSLKPRVILTLIDDIYDIYTRIIAEHKSDAVISGGKIIISDILSWRIREIHTCNLLAKHLYINRKMFPSINSLLSSPDVISKIPKLEEELNVIFNKPCDHFVISIKQDPEDFYRLLFDYKKLRVYLSFPISTPRKAKDDSFFDKLLAFRKKIHADYIAFDPLAIDELRFVVNKDKKGNKIIKRKLTNRIIYGVGTPIVSPPGNTLETCPIREESESLEAIFESVVQQVNERDLKLTSQADYVVMWRPLYGKETHDGVAAEGTFAAAKGITVHSYHPIEDRIKGKPFIHNIGTERLTEDALFKALKDCQKEYEKKQIEEAY